MDIGVTYRFAICCSIDLAAGELMKPRDGCGGDE
jgi:hypothetical protein